jgi:hypothetical protein
VRSSCCSRGGRCRKYGEKFRADQCVILYGDELGWEAALFDHFQALVTAIASKVTQGKDRAARGEVTGGSTYHFDLYRGHPKEREVLDLLTSVRERASALRAEVESASVAERGALGAVDGADAYRVVFYVGQNAVRADLLDTDRGSYCISQASNALYSTLQRAGPSSGFQDPSQLRSPSGSQMH